MSRSIGLLAALLGLIAVASAVPVQEDNAKSDLEPLPRHLWTTRHGHEGMLRKLERSEHDDESVQATTFHQTQPQDHFNSHNTNTWQQRYYFSEEFYQSGGPNFIMLGGEGPQDGYWLTHGTWVSLYAPALHPKLYSVEHRYYGLSHPTSNIDVANLKWLTVDQALADFAAFIQARNRANGQTDAEAVWIVFGGSYSGNLAAWLRLKYPKLVHAAVASSSPVHAKADMSGYLDTVSYALNHTAANCVGNVRQAFTQLIQDTKTAAGARRIMSTVPTCRLLNTANQNDIDFMVAVMANQVKTVVQYNHDAGNTRYTISDICRTMVHGSGGYLVRYAKVLHDYFIAVYGRAFCIPTNYAASITEERETSYERGDSGRLWTYQTCTEFGYFQSSDSTKYMQPFSKDMPLSWWEGECKGIFGTNQATINAGVKGTNADFGGKSIVGTTNRTVFTNGLYDPWHVLGVTMNTTNANLQNPVIVMKETSHVADMYSRSPIDPPDLIQARKTILMWLQRWVL